ncbi:enoyl-CoA hydratase-related protein [Sulfitobacter sp. F26169L]|uniref:enoyl-CoA hydratase-related protein n=1 Tax=Sulfitobacter sp. F26169L TaxID=2996015 RepID=UPI0022608ABD|nr:enoyl-CoA hydratase-related protein [Sulfitobacter sp. F26169L]MCX7567922.1 enoyl-CoA hydratase-related protein [Sulfitobacter sp. F26169L]
MTTNPTDDRILVTRDGAVCIIRLNNPDALNAMDMEMAVALRDTLRTEATSAGAIILAGDARAFCSGANLSGDIAPKGSDLDAGLALEDAYNPLMETIRALPVPFVTAVRGAAAGVGASLALSGDIIVAGRSAYFLEAFARIGLVPDGGAAWLLTRAVGRVRAMKMMLLAEKLYAEQAFEWGLISELAEDDAVEEVALKLAQKLAAGPTRALALTRQSAWAACDASFTESIQLERNFQREAGQHPDFAEGVAAFREKRPARFGE